VADLAYLLRGVGACLGVSFLFYFTRLVLVRVCGCILWFGLSVCCVWRELSCLEGWWSWVWL